jgi:hypothetical protein
VELALSLGVDDENPDVGDLRLVYGQLVFTDTLADEVAQRILVMLNFFRGEWFLNLDAGTPYLEAVIGKGIPASVIRNVFTRVILACPGVAAVDKLEFTTTATRTLELEFVARLEDGATFRSTNYGPFVVKNASLT